MIEINILDNHDFDDISINATEAIQSAIDKCNGADGGIVTVPGEGVYIIDGIELKSNVTLNVESGATLRGSGNEERYIRRPGPFELIRNNTPISGLIFANGANNIAVTGDGTIDGNFEKFIFPDQGSEQHLKFYKYPRPMMFYFENCRDVKISNLHIINSPFWTIHLVGCFKTEIDSIFINNEMRMPNTDGIDIDRGRETHIHDCTIVTGDDGICPKCTEETAKYGDCNNIKVERCNIKTRSSAIKFGSSSFGNFEDCYFTDLKIEDTNRGIAFQIRDPGSVRNITFENITIKNKTYTKDWWGSGEPIYITLVQRDEKTDMKNQVIDNISFLNINCESDNGIFIYSSVEGAVRDIYLRDVNLKLNKPFKTATEFDLRPNYGSGVVTSSHIGLNTETTANLVLTNVQIEDSENEIISY
ncbi:glycosyl hydrolase family 28 protein [Paucilactobacillus suebicus]|uniref:glycoside hydrolase family 28 protein n=1 Tax=Paucilactobacillus suebicus TaxID=152335 RepID=UPI0002490884|nr:glycosyl hydrolase family 28 protein [Paucilactobacillus suebicus]